MIVLMMPLILQHRNMEFIKSSQKKRPRSAIGISVHIRFPDLVHAPVGESQKATPLCARREIQLKRQKSVCVWKKAHIPHIHLYIQHGDAFLQPGRKEGHRDAQYKGGWLCVMRPGHELILSGPTNTATMLTYFCSRLPLKITHRANAIVNFASSLEKSAWENFAQVYIKKCINDTKGLVFFQHPGRVSRIYPRAGGGDGCCQKNTRTQHRLSSGKREGYISHFSCFLS